MIIVSLKRLTPPQAASVDFLDSVVSVGSAVQMRLPAMLIEVKQTVAMNVTWGQSILELSQRVGYAHLVVV